MTIIHTISAAYATHLTTLFNLQKDDQSICELTLNIDEKKQDFGDLTSNAALILAKQLGKAPRALATTIADTFTHPLVEKVELAGPGFINIYLKTEAFGQLAQSMVLHGADTFKPTKIKKESFNIEFVSANPTGPLHFGHGRGGIIGDVVTKILRFLGHDVTAEFYINDAGNQIQKLGHSLKVRCQQELGLEAWLPEGGYQGEYLIDLAKQCIVDHGTSIVEKDEHFFSEYAQTHMLAMIKETLQMYGIEFDSWFSEKQLHMNGAIEDALKVLEKQDLLFQKEGATWFRSTDFGDDKDRVVRKADGSLTYIAADIAYLKNKVDRGNSKLVMVLGHDHHSYATRLEAVRQGLHLTDVTLDVILYQLVKIKEGDAGVRMSKRAGNIVGLRDVIKAVGTDVARFFYLHRKADAQLEFDLELAEKKTDENPVYYVQYAYVRTNSILSKAAENESLKNITADDAVHLGKEEAFILKKILSLQTLLEQIGNNYQTHLLTYYVIELATLFHSYYRQHKVINLDDIPTSRARCALIGVINMTLNTVLHLLGISTPERM